MVSVDTTILRRGSRELSLGYVAVSSFGLARVATEVSSHSLKGEGRDIIIRSGLGATKSTVCCCCCLLCYHLEHGPDGKEEKDGGGPYFGKE